MNNSFRVLKVLCDIAREGKTALLPEVEFTVKQQNACQVYLTAKTVKLTPFPDGYDALCVAVTRGCSEAVQVLSYTLTDSQYNGLTPLMLAA